MLADSTQFPFCGVIRLPIRVRDVKVEEAFVVSRISEDAILSRQFVMADQCSIDFTRPVLQEDKKELVCTDRHRRLLLSLQVQVFQVMRAVVVPAHAEMSIQCRITERNFCAVILVKGRPGNMSVATILNRWESVGQMSESH